MHSEVKLGLLSHRRLASEEGRGPHGRVDNSKMNDIQTNQKKNQTLVTNCTVDRSSLTDRRGSHWSCLEKTTYVTAHMEYYQLTPRKTSSSRVSPSRIRGMIGSQHLYEVLM